MGKNEICNRMERRNGTQIMIMIVMTMWLIRHCCVHKEAYLHCSYCSGFHPYPTGIPVVGNQKAEYHKPNRYRNILKYRTDLQKY